MTAARKILGWFIVLLSAWMMGKWVYRHTNEDNCQKRGGAWDAAADSCAHPLKPKAH